MTSYTLAAAMFSKCHGIAALERNNLNFSYLDSSAEKDATQWTTTQLMDIRISIAYNPPIVTLDLTNICGVSGQHIIYGNFNCHHELWNFLTEISMETSSRLEQ